MLQKINISNTINGFNINIEELNRHYSTISVLNSNEAPNQHYLQLIAIDTVRELSITEENNALTLLQKFIDEKKSWLFGCISYDLKNEIESLSSSNPDEIKFPTLHFFEPKYVIECVNEQYHLSYDDAICNESDIYFLQKILTSNNTLTTEQNQVFSINKRISKSDYIKTVNQLKNHIQLGNIYEVNYCQEFYSKDVLIQPFSIYKKLNAISLAPFAAFCKFNNLYIISSSPERFIKKTGNKLISQPIKGTAKRSNELIEDERLKTDLQKNPKERTENVMIVDIVRNDLSKIAERGSVQVDELFGIYSFKQVHQLISSIGCKIKNNTNFTDIIKACFPMGSMTGAPKIRAMQLIEEYEKTKRGIYSGALGYITPEGDFDFSVIIRTILYNSNNNTLSFMVGSAITAQADAEQEYEECLLKAKAMLEVLGATH